MNNNDLNNAALTNRLSRKTHSVTRDTKRNQLIIVQEVSVGVKDTEGYRAEQSYYMYEDPETSGVNALLCKSRDLATMAFLGLTETKTSVVEPSKEVEEAPIVDIDTPEVKVEEKPKAKAAKKPRKKAVKKEEVVQAPAEVYTADDDDGLGLDDSDDDTNELYEKGNTAHAAHLKTLLNEKYGKAWPKDKEKVGVVKGLVEKIKGTLPVMDGEGEMLASFETYVVSYLKKA